MISKKRVIDESSIPVQNSEEEQFDYEENEDYDYGS